MKTEYVDFWKAKDMTEAWTKIVSDTKENDADTADTIDVLINNIKTGGIAVEIGCGVGRLMKAIKPFFTNVEGFDISDDMVNLSRRYLDGTPNCVAHWVRSVEEPAFPYFNVAEFVYSYICFQHIPKRSIIQNWLRSSHEVLKPGGAIRIQTMKGAPNKGFEGYHGHFYDSATAFADEFTEVGFEVISATQGQMHPEAIWVTAIKP